jgi:hypothetical protein
MHHKWKKIATLLWILAASFVFWWFFSDASSLLSLGFFMVWVAVMTLIYYEATEKEKQFLSSYGYTLWAVYILWNILAFFFTGDGIWVVQSTTSMIVFFYATLGDMRRWLFRWSYKFSLTDIVYGVTGIICVYMISLFSFFSLMDYFYLATVILLLILFNTLAQWKKITYLKKNIWFWLFFWFWLSTFFLLLIEKYIGI